MAKSRIVIVDDSVFMRTMLRLAINRQSDMEVVGEADDGAKGLEMILDLKPSAVTLDIEMPGLTGLEVLEKLFKKRRVPVVVVSTKTQRGAQTTLDAMQRGAVTCVAKPVGAGGAMQDFQDQVMVAMREALCSNTDAASSQKPIARLGKTGGASPAIIALGISAGGPPTLHKLLPALPEDFPAMAITQHMPEAFLPPFVRRLNDSCPMSVKVAEDGDAMKQGQILVAPGSHHLRFRRSIGKLTAVLGNGPKVSGFRPSVDAMFLSLAENSGANIVAIVMTGMGCDGAEGIKALKKVGAQTLAQDQSTSIVYGMPKAAADTGAVDHIVKLEDVPKKLAECCNVIKQGVPV